MIGGALGFVGLSAVAKEFLKPAKKVILTEDEVKKLKDEVRASVLQENDIDDLV